MHSVFAYLSANAKDEYYNPLTLKLERKMQKFDLRLRFY